MLYRKQYHSSLVKMLRDIHNEALSGKRRTEELDRFIDDYREELSSPVYLYACAKLLSSDNPYYFKECSVFCDHVAAVLESNPEWEELFGGASPEKEKLRQFSVNFSNFKACGRRIPSNMAQFA